MVQSSRHQPRIWFAIIIAAILITCTGTQAVGAPTPADAAARALGRGDGAAAARIIIRNGDFNRPKVLASIIYAGGTIAVAAHKGNAFAQALPIAFVRGHVTLTTANLAFERAAMIVAQQGATNASALVPQLAPGGLAITRTELAYADVWLPGFPN